MSNKPLSENDIWQTLGVMAGQRLKKPAIVCKVCLEDKPDHAKDCAYAVLEAQLAEAHYEFGRTRSVAADRELQLAGVVVSFEYQLAAMREALTADEAISVAALLDVHPGGAIAKLAAHTLRRYAEAWRKAAGEAKELTDV